MIPGHIPCIITVYSFYYIFSKKKSPFSPSANNSRLNTASPVFPAPVEFFVRTVIHPALSSPPAVLTQMQHRISYIYNPIF